MARYQLIVAYDGTNYCGFQKQGFGRSVQAEIESALKKIGWPGGIFLAAGRTDCGVHALGQVIAIDMEWKHSVDELRKAMNSHLPPDVSVRQAAQADATFHPRYGARLRTYQYTIYCDADRNPLLERYCWRVWPAVPLHLLETCAGVFIGKHDFSSFGSPPRKGGNPVRSVFSSRWWKDGALLKYEISADAFLYHMVRRMVFLQVLVGQGRLDLAELEKAVLIGTKTTEGLAPPNGLMLVRVDY